MSKITTKILRAINPLVRKIEFISSGGTISRHGNCYDIALPKDFVPSKSEGLNMQFIRLGVRIRLPKYYRAVLLFRSSTAVNYNYITGNGIGEIEWNYSKEWMGLVYTHSKSTIAHKGARLFQFYIEPLWDAPWYIKASHIFATFVLSEVKELDTTRGGFGSSGK